MKTSVRIVLVSACSAMLIVGCDRSAAPPQASTAPGASATAPQTALGRMAAKAIDEARVKLARENINLNGQFFSGDGHHNVVARVGKKDPADPRPDAELTPAGELLIDGKQVPVTPEQHAMLVQYRQAIMTVAETGMELGVQGADLGGQAVSEVFKGLMSGHTDDIDKNINAKASVLEARATQLCKELQPVQQMQQKLAVALPAFAPYATLKPTDIEDCGKHHAGAKATVATDADRAEIQQDIRREIRQGIRDSVKAATQVPANQDSKQPSAATAG
jgi:hypothetical protein